MSDEKKQGNRKETFLLQIKFQENSSWQGTMTWIEKKKDQRFRSTLEMIKLIDNALESSSDKDDTKWK